MKIVVFGAGAWGTALAAGAAARHEVSLWARDASQARAIAAARENARYLPGLRLPESIAVRAEPLDVVGACALADAHDIAIVATPMAALRGMLATLRDCRVPVAWLCKGFEAPQGLLGHEIRNEVAPALRSGILSGP